MKASVEGGGGGTDIKRIVWITNRGCASNKKGCTRISCLKLWSCDMLSPHSHRK